MATDFLISFDDLKAGSAAVKKLVQAFTRAGVPVASSDIDPKTRRTSGVNYRQVLITFTDNQKVLLGVKTTGDIFEVRVNGAVLALKNQDDQIKAVGEIAKALDASRAKFQAKMARTKVALPKGITTTAPKMEQRLQEAETTLDTEIAAAKAKVAELRAELGEPVMDGVSREKDMFWVLKEEYGVIPANAPVVAILWAAGRVWANGGDWKSQLDKLNKERERQGKPIAYSSDVVKIDRDDTMDSAKQLFAHPPEAWPTSWLGFRVVDDATVMDRAASALPSTHQLSAEVDLMLSNGDGAEMPLRGRVVRASFRAGKVNYDVALPIALDATGGVRAHAVIPDVDSALVRPAAGALDSVKAYAGEIRENAAVLDSTHEVGGETFDGGEWDTLIGMKRHGKLEDGDVPSKGSRDSLVERGFVERGEGFNWLTDKGKEVAAALDSATPKLPGLKSVAHRMVNSEDWLVETLMEMGKISKPDAVKAAKYYLKHKLVKLDPIGGRGNFKHGAFLEPDVIKRSVTLDSADTSLLDAVDVPLASFDRQEVIEAQVIASRLAAGDILDDADLSHARATLENALDTVETNHPINVAEGNLEQAELEERAAESFRAALKMLESKEPLAA